MRHKNKKSASGKFQGERRKVQVLGVAMLLTLVFSFSTVSAQESINATGGNASGSRGSVNYSVGQVVYTTNTGTNGSVAQGVQQSFEISAVTGLDEAKGITLLINVYPNPTADYLTLCIDEFNISNLSYQLFDMNGKLLQNEKITGNQTSIVMSNLTPATYFVKVIQGNKEVKIFKIIKN